MNTKILGIATFIYLGSFVCYLLSMATENKNTAKLGYFATVIGFITQGAGLIIRWLESYQQGVGHIPLSNFYESLIFFAWSIIGIYLWMERRIANKIVGVFIIPIAFLLMAFASISPGVSGQIEPLVPALQSNWLTSHVVTCFLGYAGFTMAFSLGLLHFLKAGARFTKSLSSVDKIDDAIYFAASFGFIMLTIGIITGSIWAHYAWGSYWSWDPKETWSLITWFIYVVMLHGRYTKGWSGKRTATFAIVGFVSVIVTYLGVNYLPGLHSYL